MFSDHGHLHKEGQIILLKNLQIGMQPFKVDIACLMHRKYKIKIWKMSNDCLVKKNFTNMQTMGERVIIIPNKKKITKENKVPR
jgi:hypothetical protein